MNFSSRGSAPHPARATALDPRGGALTQRESAEGWGFTPEGSGAHASAVFRRWGFTVKPQVSPSTHPWGYLLNHTRGSEVAVTGYHH